MKKIDDSKIYLTIFIVPLIIAAIICGISLYSIIIVEPKAKALIDSEVSKSMKEGYIILRTGGLFGKHNHWDIDGDIVRKSIKYYDNQIYNKLELAKDDKRYLNEILNRRESGSKLGIKTSLFLLIVSLTGLAAYIFEKKSKNLPFK
jgi:preprotein translocase subunit YajC